jgi:hypothetical protein
MDDEIESSPHRPPAPPDGNLYGLKHGGFSHQILSVRTQEMVEALIGNYPWFLDTDMVGVEQYCRAEARARLLDEFAMEMALAKGVEKVPPYIWSEISKAENNAMRAADSLGLTPLGRMKIAKDAGFAQHFQTERIGKLSEQGAALRAAGGQAAKTHGSVIDV